ncbi:hypothetical protein KKF03_01015 [Patescibacteria group bacterium]|nr:hypothetical protein [Patescibacteria group bacterium]
MRSGIKHKKIVISGLAIAVLVWLMNINGFEFIGIQEANAQATSTRPDQMLNDSFFLVGTILGFFHWLTLNLVHVMEMVLDPNNFIEISIGESGPSPLNKIWQFSRDIMNLLFAFLLIAGGIVTLVTAKKDLITQNMPKFILAVVLVNFSWFFPRVILDVSNILTSAIYSLPSAISAPCEIIDDTSPTGKAPCQLWENIAFNVKPEDVGQFNTPDWECIQSAGSYTCFQLVPMAEDANSPHAILLGIVINHTKILELAKIRRDNPPPPAGTVGAPLGSDTTQRLLTAIIQIGFAFLIVIALMFPLIAMLVVFIIRIPILWLTISFMPFMFLGFLIGDKMGKANTMDYIWKNFLSMAFLPALVAIPLTVGFILLNTGVDLMSSGGITLNDFETPQNFMLESFTTFLDLLWLMMALAVIWIGTFAALSVNKITEAVSTKIKGWGESWGKLAATMPLRIPFMPFKDKATGEKVNLSLMGLGSRMGPAGINEVLNAPMRRNLDRVFDAPSGTSGTTLHGVLNSMPASAQKTTITNNLNNKFDAIINFDATNAASVTAAQNAIRTDIPALMKQIKADANTGHSDISQLAGKMGRAGISETRLQQILAATTTP